MKKALLLGFIFCVFQIYSCEDGMMYYITTDQAGFAQEFFKIPANGKFKITDIDAQCSEMQKGGRIYKTHYLFTLRELTLVLDCDCDNFKEMEYIKVEKGDKIRMAITHGEATSKYKIKYDFKEDK
jgi:hypothetical protein